MFKLPLRTNQSGGQQIHHWQMDFQQEPMSQLQPVHISFCQKKIWDPQENAGVLQYCTIYQYDNMIYVFFCVGSIGSLDFRSQFIWTCFLKMDFAWGSWAGMAGHTVPLPLEFIDVQLLNDLSRITDVICNCPIDWSMISMCGHQVTDWIQLTVPWSRISRWFCCLLILMFSWTMVFHMVFKLSTIIESDQKHFLHSRMWVFVAWCMSCGLWHSSPAHIFYWNGVPRPRYGSAQCSMAVKLLNDLGRLNSLWRRN